MAASQKSDEKPKGVESKSEDDDSKEDESKLKITPHVQADPLFFHNMYFYHEKITLQDAEQDKSAFV